MTAQPASSVPYGAFADYYDLVYKGLVDYPGDTAFVAEAFERFADRPLERVIDAGCGTGTHALLLADRGVRVDGIDVAPGLLAEARDKAASAGDAGTRVTFHEGDMAKVLPEGTFDGLVSLFGAFNYLVDDADAERFLALAAHRVAPGGLLVLEFWNPIGVQPQKGWIRLRTPDGRTFYRLTESTFDRSRDVVTLDFEVLVVENGRVTTHFTEEHALRTRTAATMKRLLAAHGFDVMTFAQGDREGKAFTPATFDAFRIMVIAKRR